MAQPLGSHVQQHQHQLYLHVCVGFNGVTLNTAKTEQKVNESRRGRWVMTALGTDVESTTATTIWHL